jgi:hypothetical protein
MNTLQLFGALAYGLIVLMGIGLLAVYAYHAWAAPEKLRRTALRNLERGWLRWWPLRDISSQWIATPSYIIVVRIGTTLILIAFVVIIVLGILALTGVL